MVFGDVFADSALPFALPIPTNPFLSAGGPIRMPRDQTILELLKIVFYQTGGSFSRRPSSE